MIRKQARNGRGFCRKTRERARKCKSLRRCHRCSRTITYAEGNGVSRDYVQAVALYRKACDASLLGPCVNLGLMYENGTGVARDHTQALSLFRKACDGGVVTGCNNLGVLYDNDKGAATPPQ